MSYTPLPNPWKGIPLVGSLIDNIQNFLAEPVTYATSLPTSPLDIQEAILVDNTSTPTYQWRFRYNANSTNTDKWEFIGGVPYTTYNTASSASITGTAYAANGVGCSLVVPRSGTYLVRHGAKLYQGTTSQWTYMNLAVNGTVSLSDGYALHQKGGDNDGGAFMTEVPIALTAGQTVAQYSKVTGGTGLVTGGCSLALLPVRLS